MVPEVMPMFVALLLALAAADPAAAPDARASALREQARAALGGAPALSAVHGLSLQGHFRRLPQPDNGGGGAPPGGPGGPGGPAAGGPGGPGGPSGRGGRGLFGRESEGDLTLDLALPDKMRREESMALGTGPSFTMIMGLSGDRAWTGSEGATPFGGRGFGGRGGAAGAGGPGAPGGPDRAGAPATADGSPAPDRKALEEARRAAMARRMRGELSRLTLALFAEAGDGAFFTYGGQAESPDGHADVLDVTTATGEKARLFLDSATHLPLMVTYQETLPARRFRRATLPADGASPSPAPSPSPSDAAPRTVDVTLFVSGHQAVGGVQLPQRISRAVGGNVVEEWEVARWRVNPSLKPERFEKP
jgi:hypothetical protein